MTNNPVFLFVCLFVCLFVFCLLFVVCCLFVPPLCISCAHVDVREDVYKTLEETLTQRSTQNRTCRSTSKTGRGTKHLREEHTSCHNDGDRITRLPQPTAPTRRQCVPFRPQRTAAWRRYWSLRWRWTKQYPSVSGENAITQCVAQWNQWNKQTHAVPKHERETKMERKNESKK